MDWPRARAYLIAAFLLLNLFLGYRLWYERHLRHVPEPSAASASFQELLGELEAAGLSLAVALPEERPSLPALRVNAADIDSEPLLDLFENRSETDMAGEEGWLVRRPPLGVEFTPRYGDDRDRAISENQARILAEEFLARHGGMPEDVVFDYSWYAGGQAITLHYRRTVDGLSLYPARISFDFGSSGIRRVEKLLGGDVQSWDGPRRVVSAQTALRAVAREMLDRGDPQHTVIIDVQLGYWGTPTNGSWLAVPAWRVRLGDGDVLYVDAVTGDLAAFIPRVGD